LATLAASRRHVNGRRLILDDINGLAGSAQVVHWLKSTVDELSISQPETRLCILIVGLEERRQVLIQYQESLARVFSVLNIDACVPETRHMNST